mmetsp:Transcript_75950/g.246461  ORF Transcript_75950/g.246461 Transcript_75950/m.246461 type:complete len:225 (-) Transcript_75950:81-755(-)
MRHRVSMTLCTSTDIANYRTMSGQYKMTPELLHGAIISEIQKQASTATVSEHAQRAGLTPSIASSSIAHDLRHRCHTHARRWRRTPVLVHHRALRRRVHRTLRHRVHDRSRRTSCCLFLLRQTATAATTEAGRAAQRLCASDATQSLNASPAAWLVLRFSTAAGAAAAAAGHTTKALQGATCATALFATATTAAAASVAASGTTEALQAACQATEFCGLLHAHG